MKAGITNHHRHIEILGLPLAVQVDSPKPHDVRSGRELLAKTLPCPRNREGDRRRPRLRGVNKMATKQGLMLDVKAPPKGTSGFTPIAPLYRVEHAFERLGRWRRLSRCHEGSAASARAWLEVAAGAYLLARLRVEPV